MAEQYKNNHYVPEWYQKRFIPDDDRKDRKYFYLDLQPPIQVRNGHRFQKNALNYWGPDRCFSAYDLYTTKDGNWESTEIEEKFFGNVDSLHSIEALEIFTNFDHTNFERDTHQVFLNYLSLQKLRTPKGLKFLASLTNKYGKNEVLYLMQEVQNMFCATWAESVWSIVDASESDTKFIISDHPVTIYNQKCFPQSIYCQGFSDPDIRHIGSHTIFPLSMNKLLVLTNLSWLRNPYANPLVFRPNPQLFRPAMFNYLSIQVDRKLTEFEVQQINYIIKQRAYRYIAAGKKEWLYPEKNITNKRWDTFGKDLLLMPDPRSATFGGEIVIGYGNGRSEVFDEYGHKPNHKEYKSKSRRDIEWETYHAFKGEFARRFGPKRRGSTIELGRRSNLEDSPDYHEYHLSLEHKNKKHRYDK